MIKEKIYYYVEIETLSPLSIGNGDAVLTDHDLIRDGEGNVFIPATSLAGVFLHSLNEEEKKIILKEKDNEKILSPLFISDAVIQNEYTTNIRDGILVDENKITVDGAKYDIEIIEAGAIFAFRMEATIRDNDSSSEMEKVINKILYHLNEGDILIGMKSKRGFGKVKVKECYQKKFTKENLNEFLSFDSFDKQNYDVYTIQKEQKIFYDVIKVSLKQLGGISIRSYSAQAGDVDFEHIKSKQTPVIPGSSFNGLIRKQIVYYHKLLHLQEEIDNRPIDEWFGFVKEKSKQAQASKIIIEESTLNHAKEITLSRTKINRFSGGSANRALFNERVEVNGDTTLTIRIPKHIKVNSIEKNNQYLLLLLALTIKDIDNGFIALGGQTAIGRGLFNVVNVTLNEEEWKIDSFIENTDLEGVVL